MKSFKVTKKFDLYNVVGDYNRFKNEILFQGSNIQECKNYVKEIMATEKKYLNKKVKSTAIIILE